jgi:hypothetical protein
MAVALETLVKGPEVEIEAQPPVCPVCGTFDPELVIPPEDGGRGKMSQVIIVGVCAVCEAQLYIAVASYSVHASRVTLKQEMEMRKAGTENGA